MEQIKRFICLVLCLAMLIGYVPVSSHAEDLSQQGLCEHHPEHVECAYSSVETVSACTHQHEDDCYAVTEDCTHIHDGCGTDEVPCDHQCGVESGCVTESLACQHQHDSECGYGVTTDITPCDFVCSECVKKAEDQTAADEVAALIAALPVLDDIKDKVPADQQEDYNQVQTAYDAYCDLTTEQQDLLPMAEEVFKSYFEYFNSMTHETNAVANGTCGENLTWVLTDEGTLTISGTGAMYDYTSDGAPWAIYQTQIQHLVIDSGVTSIGSYAFADLYRMVDVSIADSVQSIGNHAFTACTSLDNVPLPENITVIGANAFSSCDELIAIGLPAKLKEIQDWAFSGCTKLQTIIWPNALESIGEGAFQACYALADISIPDTVTIIESGAFSYCTGLQYLTISKSMEELASGVFSGCTALEEVIIPDSISVIAYGAFENCSVLEKITFNGSAPNIYGDAFTGITATAYYPKSEVSWTADKLENYGGTITWAAYGEDHIHDYDDDHKCECGAIGGTCGQNLTWTFDEEIGTIIIEGTGDMNYFTDTEAPWGNYREQVKTVVIQSGVTNIGGSAFIACENLTNVTIPDSVTSIEDNAFNRCDSLTGVTIPNSVLSIADGAFYHCVSLKSIAIPDSVTQLDSAFESCSNLETVTLPRNITYIDDSIFAHCTSLSNVIIPESVTNIGKWAFYNCASLGSISIPDNVTSIGSYAFYGCTNMTKVTFGNGVHSIDIDAFYGCSNLTDVCITDIAAWVSIHTRGRANHPFYCNDKEKRLYLNGQLITELVIPDGVTRIEDSSFCYCSSIRSISFPESVAEIGWSAFAGCSGLTSVNLPDGVVRLEESAFSDCTNLREITFEGNAPEFQYVPVPGVTEKTTFRNVTAVVYYPAGNKTWTADAMQQYGGTITWKPFGEVSGTCGSNMDWCFNADTGTLIISGAGWMYAYSEDYPAPWSVYAKDIKELDLTSMDTCINSYAFAGCESITSVTIPDVIYWIEEAAFSGCTSLKTITFTGDSPSIAEDAFTGVTATAYYPAGWYWHADDFANYGGKITWIETGVEAKKMTVSLTETMAPGMKIQNYVSVRPWNATGEYTVSVSNPDVLEFVSIENDYIEICALQAGTSTVTVKELRSGLEYSGEVTVVEPQVVFSPCSMSLQVPAGDSVRYLSFVPEVTGTYQFSVSTIEHLTLSYGGYGGSIYILNQGEWVESTLRGDDDMKNLLADLNAGTFYIIGVPFYLSAYEQTALFTIEQVGDNAGTDGTILQFYQEHENVEYMPGEDQHHYLSVNYNGSNPLTWKSSNPSILEIEDVYTENDYCNYKINGEGTAVITVSNGILSDSITITTQVIEFAELYLQKTVTSEENYIDRRYFGFVAPEAGRYAFAVSTDDGSVSMGFNHWSDEFNIMFSYGESSCTGFRTMEAGEVCQFYVWSDQPTCTIRVSKAAAKPLSMKIALTSQYEGFLDFGVSFSPGNACDRVVKWEIDNREIAAESSNPKSDSYSNEMTYEIFKDGSLTVTATSESGLKASFTMEVHPGLCKENHAYGNWVPILDENGEQTGRERRQCEYCDVYQERKMPPIDETVENRVVIDATEMTGQNTVWIDGVEYVLQRNGNKCYVDLPDGNARTMVTYTYSSTVQNRYPVGMKVWTLENIDGIYTANRQESFDDILQYSGMSIRVTGKKGIRMVTGIEQDKKNALISGGLEGYTLKEYGTVVAWASKLTDVNPLTLGQSYAMSNYAYKKGVADPVFAYSGSLMQYTNVLVNFSDEQCKDDIAMRPYMILEDKNGEELTIYGGIVTRSIGYIAYQNRNVFEPQTEEYNYIWDIIHYVYGDVHDDEFIHAWTPITK